MQSSDPVYSTVVVKPPGSFSVKVKSVIAPDQGSWVSFLCWLKSVMKWMETMELTRCWFSLLGLAHENSWIWQTPAIIWKSEHSPLKCGIHTICIKVFYKASCWENAKIRPGMLLCFSLSYLFMESCLQCFWVNVFCRYWEILWSCRVLGCSYCTDNVLISCRQIRFLSHYLETYK